MKNIKNKTSMGISLVKRKMLLTWITGIVLFCMGCDNFVDIDLPKSQLNSSDVFQDKATADAAMTNIYAKIRDTGLLTGGMEGMSHQLGNYTDELTFYGNASATTKNFYTNSLLVTNRNVADWWNFTYNQIYDANALYEGVHNSTALATEDKNRLKGEALFVRALLHFYLVNLYGNIPYIVTTDYTQNSRVYRLTENEVYIKIKTDLTTAIELLPEKYYSAERVRPNKFVAHALLSRVDLYMGLWDEAANEASAVLNNTIYSLQTNLDVSFLKDSPATIWQFSSSASGNNTIEATTFIFNSGPPPNSALSQKLIESFEAGDKRKTQWTTAITDGNETWFYPSKYKQNENTGSSTEFSIVLRIEEQYLIRAEARARQGDLIGAKEDLNSIRNKAGIGETKAVSQQEIIDAVLRERNVELFTEFGHRFFDLKRTNNLDTVLISVKPGWNSYERQLPLPQAELLLNPNLLPQNTGY
jgi:hypothetical protein